MKIYLLEFESGSYDSYQKDILAVTDRKEVLDWWVSQNEHRRDKPFVYETFELNDQISKDNFPTIRGYSLIVNQYNWLVRYYGIYDKMVSTR